ncbi:MAG TPA: carbamoyl phosphate synthase small subunit, partial [Pirellulales bacterium]|nr:carbamoyl phosphate synthase small subunit [Pirellulales bacterium]
MQKPAKLALEDGTVYTGLSFGAEGEVAGEVCFNTSMTGYQEILTDPSYRGQIVAMTYPEIGNYGVNLEDLESAKPHLDGFVVRQNSPRASNFRASGTLEDYLVQHQIPALEGIDTRALVRRLRTAGAMKGILSTVDLDDGRLVRKAQESPGLVGRDLVREVMPSQPRDWQEKLHSLVRLSGASASDLPNHAPHIVAVDYGMKWNIARHLFDMGCRVTIVPGTAFAQEILAQRPD